MIKYSFAFPTRGRPTLLKRCIRSIHDNAKDKDCFEVVLRIDDDDKETRDLLERNYFKGINVRWFSGPRLGYDNFSTVWDQVYENISGAYIHIVDDFIFMVPEFDVVYDQFLDKPCVFGYQTRHGVTRMLMEQDEFYRGYGGHKGKCDTYVWLKAKEQGIYYPAPRTYRRG